MDFSLIIVSWNVRDQLKHNLESLRGVGGVTFETIVIDNASHDGTAAMVASEFPDVTVIANDDNRGFAAACNQGLRRAEGTYALLLNPDMALRPDTLANLKRWLDENKQAAVAGIKLVDGEGNTIRHVRRFPKLFDQLIIALKLPHLFPRLLDSYIMSDFDYSRPARVDSIRGAFFCIRRSTVQSVGLLDERYFIWFEEVDYCRRIRQQELEVWYTPAAVATDYIGQSFNQVSTRTKQAYFRRSLIAYFSKWQPAWQTAVLRAAWSVGGMIAAGAEILHLKSRAKT